MEQQALAGRYALGPRVGAGGMAEVFEAHDTRLQRDVAVKLFRAGTADGIERGSAEARLLAGLDHPGLVRVLDMDSGEQTGDQAYLVMELVRGPDLGVLLRRVGALGREEVRLLALDLARTLEYIHGRGIVHRDIKPSNILTRPAEQHENRFGNLLTDFGIARFFDGGRMTATGQVIGSVSYFSPEQARGDDVGQPSDVYSLGLVLIECLTGEKAFPGTGAESALVRLQRGPSIPHAAGPGLSAALMSMTLQEPEARPTAAALVRTLTALGPLQPEGVAPVRPVRGNDDDEPGTATSTAASTASAAAPSTASATVPSTGAAASPSTASASGAPASPSTAPATDEPTASSAHGAAALQGVLSGPEPTAPVKEGTETAALARAVPVTRQLGRTSSVADTRAETAGGGPADSPQRASEEPVRYEGDTQGPGPGASETQPSAPSKQRRILQWGIAVVVLIVLAAALWLSGVVSIGSDPELPPLPAVPGEPGERLQELYESVQP